MIQGEILKMVKKILPGAIYYCVSGQITIWLISIFGKTESVAQLGALGRFAILLSLFSVLISTLVIPRYARLLENKALLLKRFMQILFSLIILICFIVSMVYLLSDQLLWVLGKNYYGLKSELILSIAGASIGLIGGVFFSLYTSRGWAINPLFSISISLMSIGVGAIFFNVATLNGVLIFNMFLAVIQVVLHGGYCLIKIINIK